MGGAAACLLLLFAVAASPAAAAATFVVGDAAHPWQESGRTPGDVIQFVDRLATVVDPSGQPLFSTQDTTSTWILPLRLRSDFNISRGLLQRGGSVDVPTLPRDRKDPAQLQGMLNGNHKVAFDRKFIAGRVILNNGIGVRLDLGARFGVNRIVFYPRASQEFPFQNDFLRGYELYVNDGLEKNLFASGQPIFGSPAVRNPDNGESRVDLRLEPQFVRFLELRSISTLGFEIDEIEIYGTGFVPTARYESDVFDLGSGVVWGDIGWTEAVAGPEDDSSLEVRVRSGADTTPDIYYRRVALGGGEFEELSTDESGQPLSRKAYDALRDNEQGAIRVDADNWSGWQLVANGQDLELPAPRRYFQFRLDFRNRSLGSSRAVGDLAFRYERPPVDGLTAEISPDVAVAGQTTTFTLAARVDNRSGRPGFERFDIETPVRVESVHSVSLLDSNLALVALAEFGTIEPERLPLQIGDFAVEAVTDDLLRLRVPTVKADGAVLQVVFDAAVFRYGTRFRARAFRAVAEPVPLLTEPGDATPALDTDRLLVRVAVGSKVTGGLDVAPPVITPNGDGVNDVGSVVLTLLHLTAPTPVTVRILDLSGRRVRELSTTEMSSGRHTITWDGTDDAGRLVPPGVYIATAEVRTDGGRQRVAHSATVAY